MPVWVCRSCGHNEVLGSVKELERFSPEYKKGMGLHRPWVDRYTIKCPKCGGTMERVPEILLSDFITAANSWEQLHYPSMQSEFKRWWPADLMLESISRSRTLAFSQMAASSALFDKAPFRRVLGAGRIKGVSGKAWSAMMSEYGTDLVRFVSIGAERPWLDRKMERERMQRAAKLFHRLWNIHRFLSIYMRTNSFRPEEVSLETVHEYGLPVDRWMLSVIESSKDAYIREMDSFNTEKAARTGSRCFMCFA